MKLDDEFLAFETQFANFCPRERVDFGEVLKNDETRVCDGQLQSDSFVVLDTLTQLSIPTTEDSFYHF